MRLPPPLRWTLLAIAGLAVAIAVAIAASHLISERIGLASEPLRAGDELAPAATGPDGRPQQDRDGGPGPAENASTTLPPPLTTTTTAAPASTPAPAPKADESEADDD